VDRVWERAVSHGDVEGVLDMLQTGTDVDARNAHNQTALMIAAQRGHLRIVDALVEAGAALNATAKYGLSALMLAVVAGHEAVAARLVQAGADVTLLGSGAPGFAGKTVKDLAVERGMREVVAILTRGAG
jgi:hypothetical protein